MPQAFAQYLFERLPAIYREGGESGFTFRMVSLFAEVIEAIDGPITLNECVPDRSACVFGDECPVHDIWCDTQNKLVEQLSKADFGALLKKNKIEVLSVDADAFADLELEA